MKKIIIISLLLVSPYVAGAQISLTGSRFSEITPAKSTGLDALYVVQDCADATINYTAASGQVPSVERFSMLGGGYAEPQSGVSQSGSVFSWAASTDGMGYIVTEGSRRTCFWIVNYASAPYDVRGITLQSADCDRTSFVVDGSAAALYYYSINGQAIEIDRDIAITYSTLEYIADDNSFRISEASRSVTHVGNTLYAPAALCDTRYAVHPDRFAQAWGTAAATVESDYIPAVAVEAHTKAVQSTRDADNEIKNESDNLGGSAPCEVSFSAAYSDAAVFHRWEVSSSPEFEPVDLIFDQSDFTYTFTEAGNTYIRFVANNAAGTCEYAGDIYTVSLGDSRLECPNAFSPANQDGVNDEWKVSYSSIVDFHCDIFNRWGKKLATLTDPSQGWDGRAGGKFVGPGVYFYVIKATGADGKKYNLSGDINVIGSRQNSVQSPDVEL